MTYFPSCVRYMVRITEYKCQGNIIKYIYNTYNIFYMNIFWKRTSKKISLGRIRIFDIFMGGGVDAKNNSLWHVTLNVLTYRLDLIILIVNSLITIISTLWHISLQNDIYLLKSSKAIAYIMWNNNMTNVRTSKMKEQRWFLSSIIF